MAFDILGRRPDGRGTVELERDYGSEAISSNTARAIFDSDHSWTLLWVMDRDTHQAVEVFSRPVPGGEA